MNTSLPLFEDTPVAASDMRVSGRSTERVGSLDIGEEVFLVVKAHVAGVGHEATDIGLVRRHKLVAEEMLLISADDGARFLDEARALSDDRFGLQAMFDAAHIDLDTGEIADDQ